MQCNSFGKTKIAVGKLTVKSKKIVENINTICIIGAGTMGSGIAQVCAQNGFYTLLYDINTEGIEKAKTAIQKNLNYLVDNLEALGQIKSAPIVEKVEAKVSIFNQLAEVNHSEAIFATNTSSLSISAIQAGIQNPARVVGMHFFNPAPLMKLVEVVKGEQTSDEAAQTVYDLCKQLNKTPVICKDAPGFIVNRVARHYYLEAMNLVEQGNATIENVDELMEATGFKMGPFKLMDLIGMDINLAVTQSLYHAFNGEERFKPSSLQINKVAANELGKKTGKGFYNYN